MPHIMGQLLLLGISFGFRKIFNIKIRNIIFGFKLNLKLLMSIEVDRKLSESWIS